MREAPRWLLILAGVAVLIGLISFARGTKHHRGDDIGSHGTVVVVTPVAR